MYNRLNIGILKMATLGLLAIVMTGCSFDIELTVLKGQVLPGVSSLISVVDKADTPDAAEKAIIDPLSLGQICTFENSEALREELLTTAETELPGIPIFLLRMVKITGVVLNEVEFLATTGNFSSINQITMDIGADGENSGRYEAVSEAGFDTSVKLVSEDPFDLLKDANGNCITPFLTFDGTLPENDVVYDLKMYLTVKYRVGLF